MATNARRLLTVEEFLEIEFTGNEGHCLELDNGAIRLMAGGSAAHARVQTNILGNLFARLKGSGCSPYGSDMGVRTHDLSLRYPDVSVFCGRESPENDKLKHKFDPIASRSRTQFNSPCADLRGLHEKFKRRVWNGSTRAACANANDREKQKRDKTRQEEASKKERRRCYRNGE